MFFRNIVKIKNLWDLIFLYVYYSDKVIFFVGKKLFIFFFSKFFIEVYIRLLEFYFFLKLFLFIWSCFDSKDSIEGSSEFLFDFVGWEI